MKRDKRNKKINAQFFFETVFQHSINSECFASAWLRLKKSSLSLADYLYIYIMARNKCLGERFCLPNQSKWTVMVLSVYIYRCVWCATSDIKRADIIQMFSEFGVKFIADYLNIERWRVFMCWVANRTVWYLISRIYGQHLFQLVFFTNSWR